MARVPVLSPLEPGVGATTRGCGSPALWDCAALPGWPSTAAAAAGAGRVSQLAAKAPAKLIAPAAAGMTIIFTFTADTPDRIPFRGRVRASVPASSFYAFLAGERHG